MTSYVLVHGAWHGGWCWRRVRARGAVDAERMRFPCRRALALATCSEMDNARMSLTDSATRWYLGPGLAPYRVTGVRAGSGLPTNFRRKEHATACRPPRPSPSFVVLAARC